MATSAKRGRPGVVLTVFLLIIVGLYLIMGLTRTWAPKLGLDLQGGQTITLTATSENVTPESLELARNIIQQRVDGLGVGEATVAVQGDRRIVVSAPNVTSDDLVELVGATAQLSFRPVLQSGAGTGPSDDADAVPGLPTPAPSPEPSASADEPSVDNEQLSIDEVLAYTATEEDLENFANFVCGDTVVDDPSRAIVACDDEGTYKYLLGPTAVLGTELDTAAYGIPTGDLSYVVTLSLKSTGAEQFKQLTGALLDKTSPENLFAIVLDGIVESAVEPQVQITNGEAQISGSFTADSAASLANVLKYGSLPVSFEPSQVETVSATLGGEQLRVGIIAGLIGIAAVALYSFIYYRGMGIVVVASLVVAASATYAMMVLLGSAVGFSLSLAGIAGAIVGIAVTADSFVIYFERIRDEIRDGRSLRSSLVSGWEKARGTIIISDAVSLLSAVILFIVAIGSVKGFAFTLGLTTMIDLAVVFFFTKPLVQLLGRTKFFGEGHKWSGLDAEHMGVSRDSLLGRRLRRRTPVTHDVTATQTTQEA